MEIVLVAIFFASPADPPVEWTQALAPSILCAAVSAEILNARDATYYRESVYAGEFTHVARLCRECDELPHIAEWLTLPGLVGAIRMNYSYGEHLAARRQIDSIHADIIDDAIAETNCLRRVYELAMSAAEESMPMQARRIALADLRAAIGAEAFYAGRLPMCIPARHWPR